MIRLTATTTLIRAVDGQGQVQAAPDQAQYSFGQDVTLTAVPAPGWSFVRWESETSPALPWWNELWSYRTLVSVGASGVARSNQPLILYPNFTALLAEAGAGDVFDPNSIRVVEINDAGQVIDDSVPFQFEPYAGYDPSIFAAGELLVGLPGATAPSQTRLFHIYFGATGPAYPAPSFAPWVMLTATGVIDEGQDVYRIQTLAGTYYYQKTAAGFSSLIDADGNDWIGYNDAPEGNGVFRGIPNAVSPVDGGHLHPGRSNAQSYVVGSGPLRTTIHSDVMDGATPLWSIEWRFYPNHIEATMLVNSANFWFLYEGVPGGSIGDEDQLTLSDGTSLPLTESWSGNLPGAEWAFFSDATLGRSLFLQDWSAEEVTDSYRPFRATEQDPVQMTVFGFGRPLVELAPQFTVSPARFSIGMVDAVSYASVEGAINATSTGFTVRQEKAESRLPRAEVLPADNPLQLTMTANRSVKAIFAQGVFFLTTLTDGSGEGEVTIEPPQSSYLAGSVVTLTAAPSPGSRFGGWSGAVTSVSNPVTLTMTGDKTVTATFTRRTYTVTTQSQGGSIQLDPLRAEYAYGDVVTLTPIPDEGHVFAEWQGDAGGNQAPLVLTVTSNLEITALFKAAYTLNVAVGSGEQGVILIQPKKPVYVEGENLRLEAVPAFGWSFTGWEGDLAGSENPVVITMDRDKRIVARFGQLHEVVVNQSGQGTVLQSPPANDGRYAAGQTITLTAQPAVGWRFAGWSGDKTGVDNPLVFTVDDDMVVTATFAQTLGAIYLPIIER